MFKISGGDSDIRAQFFAQLASSLNEKENSKTSAATSGDFDELMMVVMMMVMTMMMMCASLNEKDIRTHFK